MMEREFRAVAPDDGDSSASPAPKTTTTTDAPPIDGRFTQSRVLETGAAPATINGDLSVAKVTSIDSGVETGNDSNDSAVVQMESNLAVAQSPRFAAAAAARPFNPASSATTPASSSSSSRTPSFFRSLSEAVLAAEAAATTTTTTVATLGHPWAAMPTLEEIDRPMSSVSRDAADTPLWSSVRPFDFSREHASRRTGRKILTFRVPVRSSSWSPFHMENRVSGKPKRSTEYPAYPAHPRNLVGCSGHAYERAVRRMSSALIPFLNERRLRVAALSNNVDEVRRLLENGVEANASDERNLTPLHLSSSRGYTEVVRLLLQHGANPSLQDSLGYTPLHLAAVTRHIAVLTLLLEAGTDPLSTDFHGCNPLQLAEMKLRLVQNCTCEDMLKVKSEVHEVVNMLLAYLKKRDGFGQQVDALSSICSRLTLSNTSNQIKDEVCDLLCNIDSLNLRDMETRFDKMEIPGSSKD